MAVLWPNEIRYSTAPFASSVILHRCSNHQIKLENYHSMRIEFFSLCVFLITSNSVGLVWCKLSRLSQWHCVAADSCQSHVSNWITWIHNGFYLPKWNYVKKHRERESVLIKLEMEMIDIERGKWKTVQGEHFA